jgi:hypothetical protein
MILRADGIFAPYGFSVHMNPLITNSLTLL